MDNKVNARSFDTVVAGGGVAGISAALAAARTGARTCLIEKEYCLGGLATLGLIVIWLPLDDGGGVQMTGGISEELARLTFKYGPASCPPEWLETDGGFEARRKSRFEVRYNAAPFMIAAEELLLQNGVTLYYDARIVGAGRRGGELTNVTVAAKRGFEKIYGKAFVDATGDADVCFFAGEQTYDCPDNRRTGWYYRADGTSMPKLTVHTDPIYGELPQGAPLYGGTSLEDISRHMADMRRSIIDDVDKRRQSGEDCFPFVIPSFHGLRTTRRLAGVFELSGEEHDGVWFEDAIGMIGDWRSRGHRYSIPYRTICAAKFGNLFAAGRCSSADKSGWELTRVIPSCAVTGQAAGTAAAMRALSGRRPEIDALRDRLSADGVLFDPSLFGRRM